MSYLNKLLILIFFGLQVNPALTTTTEFSGSENLVSNGTNWVSWTSWRENNTIQFSLVAQTTGFVLFGICRKDQPSNTDVYLIAGIHSNGSIYSVNFHGENHVSVLSSENTWVVTSAHENTTHTKLTFHRPLNSENQDGLNITSDIVHLFWGLGATDNTAVYPITGGRKAVNLSTWDHYPFYDITSNIILPADDTIYWCNIHKMPLLNGNRHIIRFEPILSEAARKHTYRFILYRCFPPEDENKFVWHTDQELEQGDHCYKPGFRIPFQQRCRSNLITVWSKGGNAINFPDNVGLPLQETPGQQEYWGLEVHYDNSHKQSGQNVTTGVRFYYTDNLREHDAGLMRVDHKTDVSLTVPPNSRNFLVSGHCSRECIQKGFPAQGINIFNVLLQSNAAGREMKLRHFRETHELDVIAKTDNFYFGFQQSRALNESIKVLPGDQMTIECTYKTSEKAVMGGLSARQEICQGWLYYYPKQNISVCGSTHSEDEHFGLLEISKKRVLTNYYPEKYWVEEPETLKGDYLESVSFKVNWTHEFREYYQNMKQFGRQNAYCNANTTGDFIGYVAYLGHSVWKTVALSAIALIVLVGLVVTVSYVYKERFTKTVFALESNQP